VAATTAATVAATACADPRQCSATSCPQSARVPGGASDPDSVFAAVFAADESDRKAVGGNQATVATETGSWFSSTASHTTSRLTADRGEEWKSHCGQLWIWFIFKLRDYNINLISRYEFLSLNGYPIRRNSYSLGESIEILNPKFPIK